MTVVNNLGLFCRVNLNGILVKTKILSCLNTKLVFNVMSIKLKSHRSYVKSIHHLSNFISIQHMSSNCGYDEGIPPHSVFNLEKELQSVFEENQIPDALVSTRLIIQHVLKQDYDVGSSKNIKVAEDQVEQIRKLCECRLARMPLQYIIKEWDFRDLCLAMIPPVFIPRPETEQLVDLVLRTVSPDHRINILEVGCGSGAICLSLLKSLPEAQIVAVDQSKMACHLTKKNSQLNGLTTNLQIVHCKLLEDGTPSTALPLPAGQVDVIVSNPPYIPSAQIIHLQPEIKLYEDLRAVEAGRDGLRVIRALLLLSQSVLRRGGQIFLEVDPSHPPLIADWLRDNPQSSLRLVRTVKDYCDRDRFVHLEKLGL